MQFSFVFYVVTLFNNSKVFLVKTVFDSLLAIVENITNNIIIWHNIFITILLMYQAVHVCVIIIVCTAAILVRLEKVLHDLVYNHNKHKHTGRRRFI